MRTLNLTGERRKKNIPLQFQRRWSSAEIASRRHKRAAALSLEDRYKYNREFPHKLRFEWRGAAMSREEVELYIKNPHIRQVFATFRDPIVLDRPLVEADRYINQGTPREKYQSRRNEWKTVEHWGQRKLIISEIEFLTMYGHGGMVVIYAGAAPGEHLAYLAALFPELYFVLVDPAPFAIEGVEGKIELRREYFTDELAAELRTRHGDGDLLFISDVRAWDPEAPTAEKEAQVQGDMYAQRVWAEILRPVASMVKFRLPYTGGVTEYPAGVIYLPVWGGRTTSEARLVIEGEAQLVTYDHGWYEDVMYAHNTRVRTSLFNVPEKVLSADLGYDRCYDCAAEIFILSQYLRAVAGVPEEGIDDAVVALSQAITQSISSSGRTLRNDEDIQYSDSFRAMIQ